MRAWFVFFVVAVRGLDVSWIPSDPEGPLPLSANYRQKLSKLCQLLKSGKPLPREVHNSKEIVYKMCQKLEASSDISADPSSSSSSSLLIYLLMAAIIIYFLYSNNFLKISAKASYSLSTSAPSSSSSSSSSSSRDAAALAREARLKKFERID
jgi:hypothetical protein